MFYPGFFDKQVPFVKTDFKTSFEMFFFLCVGMNYVFDVQHTFREVYDSTKRKIFMSQQSLDDQGQGHSESEMDTTYENQDVSSSFEVMMQIKFQEIWTFLNNTCLYIK